MASGKMDQPYAWKIIELGAVTDVDIVNREAGRAYHFTFTSTANNIPSANGGQGLLFLNAGNTDWGCQVTFSNGGIYFRPLTTSGYGLWSKII